VANFVAGIVILWKDRVKVGDFMMWVSTRGEVIRIGARGTWVQTYDNEVIIVPNSDFINSRVANWTANDRTVRITIPLGVSYTAILRWFAICCSTSQNARASSRRSGARLLVTGFGDNSVKHQFAVSTTLTTGHTGLFKSDLFMEIFRVFREKKIEMPCPQQDVHVRSFAAPLMLRARREIQLQRSLWEKTRRDVA